METGLQELKRKIDARGTQAVCAEILGIGESYLSQILSGARPFSRVPVAIALKLSDYADMTIEQISAIPDPSPHARPKKRAAGQ